MTLSLTRSILTIFVPGGVAVAPWLYLVHQRWPDFVSKIEANQVVYTAVLFGLVVIFGSVFEIFTSWCEVKWDRERGAEYDVKENWYRYLTASLDPEPVAYRYISRCVATLYFESNMAFASFMFFAGTAVSFYLERGDQALFLLLSIIFSVVVPVLFLVSASSSHLLLCKTRQELGNRIN